MYRVFCVEFWRIGFDSMTFYKMAQYISLRIRDALCAINV